MTPEYCPQCGAEVPEKAKACPECGSCEETGWSEAARAANLGLPDEDFDYQDFVQREFSPAERRPSGISWFWWLIAIMILVAICWVFLVSFI